MTFIEPFLLWGGLAVAIPVAIHFWHQKRGKLLPWAATQWLTEKNQQQSRGLRLDNIPLLLLRCLLLGLLAIMLAQPLLKPKNNHAPLARVHLVQSHPAVMGNYRFELERAKTKGEPVVWLPDHMNPLALQTAVDKLPAENTELHLYIVNDRTLTDVPALLVPTKFRLHTIIDSARKPRPYVALANQKRLYMDQVGNLVSSANPDPGLSFQTAPVHSGPIRVGLAYELARERNTVRAALNALAEVYELPLLIDEKAVSGQLYDWVLTDQARPLSDPARHPKTAYTISGHSGISTTDNVVFTPDMLTPQTSERVAAGQLPEWLGEQISQHYGLTANALPLPAHTLKARFVPAKRPPVSQAAPPVYALFLFFLGILILERGVSLTKNA